jgi:23S rRNA (pseudouridine1915-N3)-methyltransferase
MSRLRVVAVAARLPGWAESACAQYAKLMPRGYEVERILVKNDDRLRAALPKGMRIVALDERGADLGTAKFARLLQVESAFVIGGADGLPEDFKRHCDLLVRLSSLTLPHALAQVVLLEQMYRGATLLTGHPYHRE